MCSVSASNMVGKEDENYLPDLPDEISGEQLVFQQKYSEQMKHLTKQILT